MTHPLILEAYICIENAKAQIEQLGQQDVHSLQELEERVHDLAWDVNLQVIQKESEQLRQEEKEDAAREERTDRAGPEGVSSTSPGGLTG